MVHQIRKAGVVGSGVMGSAIAAHLAGAGIFVHLLDIVPPDLGDRERSDPRARNRLADGGLERALAHRPALFFDPSAARLITTGNLDDHAERLGECDLVIEAIIENLDPKLALFRNIAPLLKPSAVLASNTSGLSIARMNEALSEAVRGRFLVMHFFNPVRYMRLLELAAGPDTKPDVLQAMAQFGEFLGKGIVYAKDTPNFVANRIGAYALMCTLHAMLADGLSIESVDKITGRPMGRPKSAAFGTVDLVGIDTFAHVAKNCYETLTSDEERDVFLLPQVVNDLIRQGRLGRKSGAGFYQKVGNEILVLDTRTGEYRPQEKVRFDSLGAIKDESDLKKRLKTLVAADDPAGRFAWKVLSRTLCYSARRVGEIADDIVNIDRAMRWGYNWELGPFEAWDAVGVPDTVERMRRDGLSVPEWVERMLAAGQKSFYQGGAAQPSYFDVRSGAPAPVPIDPKQLRLDALKATTKAVVKENLGASLVDLGDGVLCLEVHTKMNTLDSDVIAMMNAAVDTAEAGFEALVLGNDGEHFGAGANLMLIAMGAQQKEWGQIEAIIRALQQAVQRLRYARVPVVAAPFQYTLGGVAEVAMAADCCQAHAETYMGLVEAGVGLIPAGGGCLRMVERYSTNVVSGADLLPFIGQASLNIAMAKVATSAQEAKQLRYLRADDGISLNRDHLLFEAKARALGMARSGYRPPLPLRLFAAGQDAAKTIGMRIWSMVEAGWASEHDALIAKHIAGVLCGGAVAAGTEVGEQHYLDLEREAFLSLCGEEKSQERIRYMLMNNKPLRN